MSNMSFQGQDSRGNHFFIPLVRFGVITKAGVPPWRDSFPYADPCGGALDKTRIPSVSSSYLGVIVSPFFQKL
jgi:hypothetical protein